MKTIAITNQKGGTGKTTTAQALAGLLHLRGLRVLSIDLDAQGNLTFATGAGQGKTVIDLLTGDAPAQGIVTETKIGDLIRSDPRLAGADTLFSEIGKEYKLRDSLRPVSSVYDYCIIDTPPQLGILTVNALTAAQYVVIPAQADIFSLQGVKALSGTITAVKTYCNPGLKIAGILLTRYNRRAILSREILDRAAELAAELGTTLFRSTIREAIAIKEAQVERLAIYNYAPKAPVTDDYRAFAEELITLVTGKEQEEEG